MNKPNIKISVDGKLFIRPIQQKDLSAEELWRLSKDKEFLLKEVDSYCVINGCCGKENVLYSNDTVIKPHEITHFRKAYSTEPWQNIDKIKDYMND